MAEYVDGVNLPASSSVRSTAAAVASGNGGIQRRSFSPSAVYSSDDDDKQLRQWWKMAATTVEGLIGGLSSLLRRTKGAEKWRVSSPPSSSDRRWRLSSLLFSRPNQLAVESNGRSSSVRLWRSMSTVSTSPPSSSVRSTAAAVASGNGGIQRRSFSPSAVYSSDDDGKQLRQRWKMAVNLLLRRFTATTDSRK
nr:hypothetical protein Iba_chr14cCG6230 [Ipomoea batatas]